MFNPIFLAGLISSLILVTGAIWPEEKKKKKPTESTKNWLFAIGGIGMLMYAVLNYFVGGSVFFIFLEALIIISTILMMLDTDDRIDIAIISAAGLGFIVWSLLLFEGYNTIFFIIGLTGIGLGYAFKMGTLRRILALTAGGALIAIFSYIEASWIFFWLNLFFAFISGYYAAKMILPMIRKK